MSKLIILGTAHLSSTPGKRSPDGVLREYSYSRTLCNEIKDKLSNLGYNCVIDYLREDMPGLNSSQELNRRVSIVNEYCNSFGAGNCAYISIHLNAAGDGSKWLNATGWECWTTPGQNNSDKLAECLYASAKELLIPLGKKIRTDSSIDGDSDKEGNLYVIKKTKCPSVLTENFFQDNKSDVSWLTSEEGKSILVDIHVQGILKYLNN